MKILVLLFTLLSGVCFAYQPHQFEGISEVYNIRNLTVLSRFLPENPIIIEAGAYEGRDTKLLAKKIPSAQIYSLEPLSRAFSALTKNTGSCENVKVFNYALGEATEPRYLYVCHGTYGQSPVFEFHSSLLKPVGPHAVHLQGPTQEVQCLSLADFCEAGRIDRVDMLWISTEGNELQVLKGAGELLDQVSVVYSRTHMSPKRESITLFGDLKQFLEKRGFTMLSHFYLENEHGDAVFIKKEKLERL